MIVFFQKQYEEREENDGDDNEQQKRREKKHSDRWRIRSTISIDAVGCLSSNDFPSRNGGSFSPPSSAFV